MKKLRNIFFILLNFKTTFILEESFKDEIINNKQELFSLEEQSEGKMEKFSKIFVNYSTYKNFIQIFVCIKNIILMLLLKISYSSESSTYIDAVIQAELGYFEPRENSSLKHHEQSQREQFSG